MTAGGVHVAVYRRLTQLYPQSFRDDYGDDLMILFANQINDEPAVRVWARTFRDLVVTIPTIRLEARMARSPSRILSTVSGVVAGTAALLAAAIGTGPAMPVLLVVALLSSAFAVWTWQSGQPVRADHAAGASWWKVMMAGAALAALTLGAMAIPWPDAIDLGDNAYWLIVIAFMASITLAATGLLLGVAAALRHRRASPV